MGLVHHKSEILSMRRNEIPYSVIGNRFAVSRQTIWNFVSTYKKEVHCRECGILFYPKRRFVYCSTKCKQRYEKRMKHLQSFLDNVDFNPNDAGCLIWQGCKKATGYGVFCKQYAHRVAYEIFRVPIPSGLHVLHYCDIPSCVNPDHLWIGTHQDNIRDRDNKNRGYWQSEEYRKKKRLLSPGQVKQIRHKHSLGDISYNKLAREYNISCGSVWKIVLRKTYKDI